MGSEQSIQNTQTQHGQSLSIQMHINSYFFVFGIPILFTIIILGSLMVSHYVTSDRQIPAINVTAPNITARLDVPAPTIIVKPADVKIDIPQQPVPYINVAAPRLEPPNVHINIPDGKKGEIQVIEKVVEKIKEVQVAIYVDTADKANVTMNDIYPAAEIYVKKWCEKNGKDNVSEHKRWFDVWNSRVTERGDEQIVANSALIEKSDAFRIDKAKPNDVVEVCRIMLRFRDAKLAIPTVFKTYVTADNLLKLKEALERGPQ